MLEIRFLSASVHGAVSHVSGKTCCSGQAGTLTDQLWPQPRLAQDCASRPAQGRRVSPDPSRPEGVGNYGRQDRECKIALLALQTVSQFVPNAKKILRPFLRFSSKEPPPISSAGATTPAHTDVAAPCGIVFHANGPFPSATS